MNRLDIGYFAGFLTTVAWLPQILRTWRLRSASEISWGYLGTLGSGIALWFVYGIVRPDASLIVANGISLVLVIFLVTLKVVTRVTIKTATEEKNRLIS